MTPDTVKARLMKTAGKAFPASSVATDPTTGQSYTSFYDIHSPSEPPTSTAGQRWPIMKALFWSKVSPNVQTYNPIVSSKVRLWRCLSTSNWRWSSEWSPTAVWGNIVLPNGSTIWNVFLRLEFEQ